MPGGRRRSTPIAVSPARTMIRKPMPAGRSQPGGPPPPAPLGMTAATGPAAGLEDGADGDAWIDVGLDDPEPGPVDGDAAAVPVPAAPAVGVAVAPEVPAGLDRFEGDGEATTGGVGAGVGWCVGVGVGVGPAGVGAGAAPISCWNTE